MNQNKFYRSLSLIRVGLISIFCLVILLFVIIKSFYPNIVFYYPRGGLGNQFFEYAASYRVAKDLNAALIICTDKYNNKASINSKKRNFLLNLFNIKNHAFLSKKLCKLISWPIYRFSDEELYYNKLPKKTFYNYRLDNHSLFQSDKFFNKYDSEISRQFTLKNKITYEQFLKIAQEIKNSQSVAIHIRRGDFQKIKFAFYSNDFGLLDRSLPIDFYMKAIKLIKNKIDSPKFFIFSDDIEMVKKEFSFLENKEFVSLTNIEDFYLMSICKSMIIANSSFSWWAAYLNNNPDKIIIAPLPRERKSEFHRFGGMMHIIDYSEIAYPKDWLTIDPFIVHKKS